MRLERLLKGLEYVLQCGDFNFDYSNCSFPFLNTAKYT